MSYWRMNYIFHIYTVYGECIISIDKYLSPNMWINDFIDNINLDESTSLKHLCSRLDIYDEDD